MNVMSLSDQVSRLVAENQNLRVKVENDGKTIHLMRSQYDALASSVNRERDRLHREIQDLKIERDQSLRAFKEIDTTLLQAADLIMQAMRARQGVEIPEELPNRTAKPVVDARIPTPRIN